MDIEGQRRLLKLPNCRALPRDDAPAAMTSKNEKEKKKNLLLNFIIM
jgi:hypothetical protein